MTGAVFFGVGGVAIMRFTTSSRRLAVSSPLRCSFSLGASVTEFILPSFAQFPAELTIVGRILAGYGELELEMCQCVAFATGDLSQAIKDLFGERGEAARIRKAKSIMKAAFDAAGLRAPLAAAFTDMNWCREIRNQYAHCQWYATPTEGLCFCDLEALAQNSAPIIPAMANRRPIDVSLLTQQEAFFKYAQKSFWYLAHAYSVWAGKPSIPSHALPSKVARPRKHN